MVACLVNIKTYTKYLDRDAQTTGRSPGRQNWWVVSMEITLYHLLGPRILRWLLDFGKTCGPS
jgi:hypothetical protein